MPICRLRARRILAPFVLLALLCGEAAVARADGPTPIAIVPGGAWISPEHPKPGDTVTFHLSYSVSGIGEREAIPLLRTDSISGPDPKSARTQDRATGPDMPVTRSFQQAFARPGGYTWTCHVGLDELDAEKALAMSVGRLAADPRLDLNGQGRVTSRDATLILRITRGFSPRDLDGVKFTVEPADSRRRLSVLCAEADPPEVRVGEPVACRIRYRVDGLHPGEGVSVAWELSVVEDGHAGAPSTSAATAEAAHRGFGECVQRLTFQKAGDKALAFRLQAEGAPEERDEIPILVVDTPRGPAAGLEGEAGPGVSCEPPGLPERDAKIDSIDEDLTIHPSEGGGTVVSLRVKYRVEGIDAARSGDEVGIVMNSEIHGPQRFRLRFPQRTEYVTAASNVREAPWTAIVTEPGRYEWVYALESGPFRGPYRSIPFEIRRKGESSRPAEPGGARTSDPARPKEGAPAEYFLAFADVDGGEGGGSPGCAASWTEEQTIPSKGGRVLGGQTSFGYGWKGKFTGWAGGEHPFAVAGQIAFSGFPQTVHGGQKLKGTVTAEFSGGVQGSPDFSYSGMDDKDPHVWSRDLTVPESQDEWAPGTYFNAKGYAFDQTLYFHAFARIVYVRRGSDSEKNFAQEKPQTTCPQRPPEDIARAASGIAAGGSGGNQESQAPQVAVPTIVGLEVPQTRQRLEAAGLKLHVTPDAAVARSVKEESTCARQDPAAGANVARGSTVEAFLYGEYKAPETVAVPNVAGKGAREAKALLTSAGFQVAAAMSPQKTPTREAKGTVERTDPAAGRQVPRDAKVTMYVYGEYEEPTVAVPNVVGKAAREAKALLTSAGFQVAAAMSAQKTPTREAKGTVERVDPAAGRQVPRDTKVTIYVYGDFEEPTVAVPNVTGMDSGAAKAALEQAGFDCSPAASSAKTPSKQAENTVEHQDPRAGQPVPRGSAVRIFLYAAFQPQPVQAGKDEWIGVWKGTSTLVENTLQPGQHEEPGEFQVEVARGADGGLVLIMSHFGNQPKPLSRVAGDTLELVSTHDDVDASLAETFRFQVSGDRMTGETRLECEKKADRSRTHIIHRFDLRRVGAAPKRQEPPPGGTGDNSGEIFNQPIDLDHPKDEHDAPNGGASRVASNWEGTWEGTYSIRFDKKMFPGSTDTDDNKTEVAIARGDGHWKVQGSGVYALDGYSSDQSGTFSVRVDGNKLAIRNTWPCHDFDGNKWEAHKSYDFVMNGDALTGTYKTVDDHYGTASWGEFKLHRRR